ncbi:MAG: hypothetical protein G3M78_04965 [Candidatus Nitrohelix vancouverensis]|uniref:Uncharacterized protein n=1 Tax=Candidatus Nitrohelix vancouverensis TaxID=2705534 RepID=A0A7T0G2Z1_9BACT|nr:MAG: hypothetical protein G3M78_04965 [Candidatus Nitrohelix vancouverensis]
MKDQLNLCVEKLKNVQTIEPKDNSPEEERARLINVIQKQIPKLPLALNEVYEKISKQETDPKIKIRSLQNIGELFKKMKQEIARISEDQYEAKLEIYRQEIFKSIDIVLDPIDFLVPNVRHEIAHLERFYSQASNADNPILPELLDLIEKAEGRDITLSQFLNGYEEKGARVRGYSEIRVLNRQFSPFQFYENSPDAYWPVNSSYNQMCKTIEPLLQERKAEPELGKFLYRVKNKELSVVKMNDIFKVNKFLSELVKKTGKKYSYRKEVKKIKSMLQDFVALQKSLIVYNDDELEKKEKIILYRLSTEAEKSRLNIILDEAKKYIEAKELSFARLDMIFSKLFNKDFNIVVQEKSAEDITISITPHHENKYGRDILERINIIVQEIDYWYPDETKQLLFQNLSQITKKIQADEPIDKKEFLSLMKKYDQEIETNIRNTYPDKIRELNTVFLAFQKMFGGKMERERLEKRLEDKSLWAFITPMVKSISRNLSVLASGNASLKKNVNKFTFLQPASEELNQLIYDLAMQMFVLFDGVEGRSVTNMTNILSTFNDCHDISALWASFVYYSKKTAMPNLAVNERVVIQMSQNPRCKTLLAEMFPES